MYDYRRMSPAERLAVVAERQARGFPLHRPPHLPQGEGWYFITAATFEHRHLFAAPPELSALETRLLEAFHSSDLACAGWVVFPNHYHALIHAPRLRVVGTAIGRVHGRSSHYANQRDRAPGRQVWYQYADRKVRSERHFQACLHYIIWNPVKHGYVTEPEEWPWSCVHELLASKGPDWLEDLLRSYPLAEMGKDWDNL